MNYTRRAILIISILLFITFLGASAQPGTISLIHYTTDDGLSHDDVTCILKDRDGFMWFGTASGLNRFDGRVFKVYLNNPDDSTSLLENYIHGITEDSEGMLWVSTHGGLCRFDKKTQRFHRIKMPEQRDDIFSNEVTERLVIDKNGIGWFGGNGFVARLNLKTLEIKRFPNPDNQSTSTRLIIDSKGRIWAMVLTALYQFDPQTGIFHYYFGNVRGIRPGVDIAEVYEDEQGVVWCGSWNLGLYRYNEAKDTFEDYPDGARISTQILEDRDEAGRRFFWTAGGADGLFLSYLEENQFYRMQPNPRNPYSHNGFMASDIYKDKETGIVWIATESGGIEKYDPNASKFRRELIPIEKEFSQFGFVSFVLHDKLDPTKQRYWIGLWGVGLLEWNRHLNTFRYLPPAPNRDLNHEVFDIDQDENGTLYVANSAGMTVYEPQTGKRQFFGDFLKYPFVWNKLLSVMVDHAGQVWMGSNYDGLFHYNPANQQINKVPFYDTSEIKKSIGYITALKEDAQYRIWIATHNGVFRWNPQTKESLFIHNGKLPNLYRSDGLCLGKNGNVWVASTQGLIQLDTSGKWIRQYRFKDGLKSEHIFDVIEDKQGMVWMATTNLLHRLNPQTNKIDQFDKQDGLFANGQTDGFNITDEGEIFIGFQNAFNFFDPSKVPFNSKPPKVALTGLKILNQERPFDPTQVLILKPNENVVSLEFAALNYSQSDKNLYAYQLEGFDQDWNFTNQPIATYTNLDGGNYTLWVKAANNDEVWSEPIALTNLRVIPPFQRTWAFVILLILGVVGIVLLIFSYRTQQRRHVEVIRDRIARDLHDDVGSTLSSIRFFSEFARSKVINPEVTPLLQRINESAAALSESLQDIIWTINSKNDQFEDLVTRMRQFGLRVLEVKNIHFNVQVAEDFSSTRLSIEQRRNIYLIFKEATINAAKYAEATEIKLDLKLQKKQLKMVISDNGKGFDLQQVTSGNGLLNMKKRAQEISGILNITSQPGAGTCIELNAKL